PTQANARTAPRPSPTASFSSSPCRRPPSPLFPYTTLFRSLLEHLLVGRPRARARGGAVREWQARALAARGAPAAVADGDRARVRSEEHTSELQSRGHLVCRLMLEKINNNCCLLMLNASRKY